MVRSKDKTLKHFAPLPTTVSPHPFPSFFLGLTSVLTLLCYSPIPKCCRGMGFGDYGQSISLHLCFTFLITLFPYSVTGSLPWDIVLHKLLHWASFPWAVILERVRQHEPFPWAFPLGKDYSSTDPSQGHRSFQKTSTCTGSSPWNTALARGAAPA